MNLRRTAARAAWPLQRACTATVIIVRRSRPRAQLVEPHRERLEEVARAREARAHQVARVVVGLGVRDDQHRRAVDRLVVRHVVRVALGVVREAAELEQQRAGVLARPAARAPALRPRSRARARNSRARVRSAPAPRRARPSTARSSASRGRAGRARARASRRRPPGSARARPPQPRRSPGHPPRRRCARAARHPRGCRTRSATRCRDRAAAAATPGSAYSPQPSLRSSPQATEYSEPSSYTSTRLTTTRAPSGHAKLGGVRP